MATKKKATEINGVSNDAEGQIISSAPYVVTVTIEGSSDILFHRWSCDDVESKAKAAKGSAAKKTDNTEAYLYRDPEGMICIPGEYVRQAVITAAKYRQDPRSPRKSAMDLYKAGVVALTDLASTGHAEPDYIDRRRVAVQRNGVTRCRPALRRGWTATFDLQVLTPEYIERDALLGVLVDAGRLVGIADFRPTFGRFQVTRFEVQE